MQKSVGYIAQQNLFFCLKKQVEKLKPYVLCSEERTIK